MILYGLSALVGCWSLLYIRMIIYTFLDVGPFDYTAYTVSEKVGSHNRLNHTSRIAVVTPTDGPRSVRNH